MSDKKFLTGAVVLGGYGQIASWRRSNPSSPSKTTTYYPSVLVMQAEQSEEGVLSPARDVTIFGKEALLALRSAIDAALSEEPDA